LCNLAQICVNEYIANACKGEEKMVQLDLEKLNKEYSDKSPEDIVRFVVENIGIEKVALASSLSIEDQVLTDILLKINPKARVFFLDTGRHFQQTYDLMKKPCTDTVSTTKLCSGKQRTGAGRFEVRSQFLLRKR